MKTDLETLARIGAGQRLVAIETDRREILKVFPELAKSARAQLTGRFSAEARTRMSAGMRWYWAKRRRAAKQST
jgi:hypothetical protein